MGTYVIDDGLPKKRKTKAKTTGVERAAKRLDAHRKATAKRLKNAPDAFELSRQVYRQMARRREKMPLSVTQIQWHRHKGYPTIGARRAA